MQPPAAKQRRLQLLPKVANERFHAPAHQLTQTQNKEVERCSSLSRELLFCCTFVQEGEVGLGPGQRRTMLSMWQLRMHAERHTSPVIVAGRACAIRPTT
eukprot:3162165-Amphidinium_carterae.1